MNSLLHPLIKTLNQYHPSYEQVLKAQNRVTSDKVVRFAQDLEFVIAVVKRSGDLHPDKVVGAKIRDEAHAYAESLGFSSAKIDRTSATLRLDVVTDYTAKNPQMQLVQSIFVKAYGVAGLAIEASVVYFIHGLLF